MSDLLDELDRANTVAEPQRCADLMDEARLRIIALEAALTRIAEHPESYRDSQRSYAVGWAFWNVQNIAKAALITAAGVPVRGEEG